MVAAQKAVGNSTRALSGPLFLKVAEVLYLKLRFWPQIIRLVAVHL